MTASYAAFISYRHVEPDRKWAKWLHSELETYRVPDPLVRERGLPQRIGRVFRDEEELAASPHLSKDIESALERSEYLIIVCSPRTPESQWVNAEVDFFHRLGRSERILSLLIEGEPSTSFPPSLFALRDGQKHPVSKAEEPLAADVRPSPSERLRSRKRMAKLRLLATILGCQFDGLRQREQERRARNRRLLTALVATALVVVGGLSLALLVENQQRREQASLRSVAEAYQVLYRNPMQAVGHAQRALQAHASEEAHAVSREAHRISLLHRSNQQDLATLATTREISWEKRAREGTVYTVLSRNGRYTLLTTERRGSRYNPELPGEVYLLDNETLQTRKLVPCSGQTADMRLEYAGFSTSGQDIFIARAFYVDIYDLQGKCLRSDSLLFQATKSPVHLVAGYLDTKYLIGADSLGRVWLMDTTGQQENRPIEQLSGSENNAMVALELNRERRAALTVYESGRVDLISFGNAGQLYHWPVLSDGGLAAAFQPVGADLLFLTAEQSGQVRVWDVKTDQLKEIRSFDHRGRPVDTAVFSDDGQWIVSIDAVCTLRIWDLETGGLRHLMATPDGVECQRKEAYVKTTDRTKSRDQTSAAAPNEEPKPAATQKPRVLPIDFSLKVERQAKLEGHRGEIFDLAFSHTGRQLASASGDGTVRVWDVATAKQQWELLMQPFEYVFSVALSPTGNLIAAGTMKSRIRLWGVTDGVELKSAIPQHWGAVHDLALSPDGRWLAVATGSDTIHVWNLTEDRLAASPRIGHGQIESCAFLPDGQRLVVGNGDGSMVLVDVHTWSPIGAGVPGHQKKVAKLSVAGQGALIASSDGAEILLWQAEPFQPTEQRIRPVGSSVSSIAVSPDGQVLATGLGNGTVLLWNTATGKQIGSPVKGHDMSSIGSVAFSPDGQTLASGGGDRTVVVWSVKRQ